MKIGIYMEEVKFLSLSQGKKGKKDVPVGHLHEVQDSNVADRARGMCGHFS
jgi:hypothetical protein